MSSICKQLKEKVNKCLKDYCEKNGIKIHFTISIRNERTIVLNIKSCSLDLVGNCIQVMESILKNKSSNMISGRRAENIAQKLEFNKGSKFDEFNGLKFDRNHNFSFSGQSLDLMNQVFSLLLEDYYNDSIPHQDYMDVSYSYSYHIGKNKGGFKHLSK